MMHKNEMIRRTKTNQGKRNSLAFLLWLVLMALPFTACSLKKPFKVGFVSDLSSKNGGISVQGRNGAAIAIAEINNQGGIDGREIELLVADGGSSPESLLAADRQMIEQGVLVLSGHMASWEAVSAQPLADEERVVLFSPTVSTPELSGRQDYFFRLMPENKLRAQALARYALEAGFERSAVVYDLSNLAYTESYAHNFSEYYERMGGEIASMITFDENLDPDFASVRGQVLALDADAVLIIASGINTALLSQYIRLEPSDLVILSTNWAYTDELIQNGGVATDGLVLVANFYDDCQTPQYLAFKSKYENTYGVTPNFAAAISYETIYFLREAIILNGGDEKELAQALIEVHEFDGLCEKIFMDRYGDVSRSTYLLQVESGKFELLDAIEANQQK